LTSSGGVFDLAEKSKSLEELEHQIAEPGFWDDNEKAQKVLKERTSLNNIVGGWNELKASLVEASELFEMAEEEGDGELLKEVETEIARISETLEEMEFRKMLSGDLDPGNAIVSINSGAGGTESQDWAGMLLRMYLRWCEKKGYDTEIVDSQEGEEAGIKSATFTVSGEYAYGYLRAEAGIHRLVRISPFDANKRRHTSFASVFILPEINEIRISFRDSNRKIC